MHNRWASLWYRWLTNELVGKVFILHEVKVHWWLDAADEVNQIEAPAKFIMLSKKVIDSITVLFIQRWILECWSRIYNDITGIFRSTSGMPFGYITSGLITCSLWWNTHIYTPHPVRFYPTCIAVYWEREEGWMLDMGCGLHYWLLASLSTPVFMEAAYNTQYTS